MKKVLSVLVAILLVSLACVPAFAADTITLNPSATEAAVGDEITISFDVAEGLTGVDSVVKYDTSYLEYVKGSATATDLMTTELNDGTDGEIHVAATCNEAAGAGTLFTAKFKVKKAGAEISATDNEVLDADGNDISDTVEIASITIADKAGEATTSSSDETTTAANGGNGGNGSNGGNGGSNGGSGSGSNTNKNPKTGNTPVVGAAAAVLVASAAVIVALKKKNED